MRTRRLFVAAGFLALAGLISQPSTAQEPKTVPDLKLELPPDVVPGTFRMFLVKDGRYEPLKDIEGKLLKGPTGKDIQSPKNREGKIHCLVCENGLAPMVAAFVRTDAKDLGPDSGVGKLAKGLNALVPKYRADKLSGFVAFLQLESGPKVVTVKSKRPDGTEFEEKIEQDMEYPDEDDKKRDEFSENIGALAAGLNVPNVPFGLAPKKSKANTAWGVKDTDEVTVIVYYRMRRVGMAWTFEKAADLTDEKVAEILKAAEKAFLHQK
ncbi:MAG: hypothetical protein K8U57_24750 [Planctomycetes bacterium]|nr:hypothetical protein [Planctomycetota bacterium]